MSDLRKRLSPRPVPDGGARLRALRALLGDTTPEALARRVSIKGLSGETLRSIETPGRERALWDYEADAIADAVGVPRSFFTAPLDRLGDTRSGS